MIGRCKPERPYPEFPLFPHGNGQWAKKIRGRVFYFGPWDDWQAALDLYLKERDELHAGRRPSRTDGLTVGDAMDRFLSSKKLLEQSGELSHRSYMDYQRTCDRVAESLSAKRVLTDVRVDDLEKLRADLGNGKYKKLNVTTLKGDLTRARCLFLYINEFCGVTLPYRKPLKSPKQVEFRKLANTQGPRLFEREEILTMLEKASVPLTAMIYLGINCGFGNSDCGTLPFSKIDLEKGWHRYERPKTHNPRRCPLWPETIEAITAAIAERPESDLPYVFLTREAKCWAKIEQADNSISSEIRKLLKELKLYRKNVTTFYSLRRTFETIGAACGEQVAVDHIMGHLDQSMASVYRQKTFDGPLQKVSDHVRGWLLGSVAVD